MPGKADIRRMVVERRNSICEEDRKTKDRAIHDRLFSNEKYRSAKTIMLYAAFRSEVGTAAIMEHALKNGKQTVLPVVNRQERTLNLYEINAKEDLVAGYMGIPEPGNRCRVIDISGIDFVLVPGVAFDTQCGRAGYGGGYYDRLLGPLNVRPYLMAIAYEEQVVDGIPLEEHDVRMDCVLTDGREIRCS